MRLQDIPVSLFHHRFKIFIIYWILLYQLLLGFSLADLVDLFEGATLPATFLIQSFLLFASRQEVMGVFVSNEPTC